MSWRSRSSALFLISLLFSASPLFAKDILLYGTDGVKRIDKAISRYQDLLKKGGWEKLETGPKIVPGETNPRIPAIRKRLNVTGELKKKSDSDVYDDDLQKAVVDFQKSHGLESDGVIGAGSIEAMNTPVEARLEQLHSNRERFLNHVWPSSKYIHVNIPDFQLYAVNERETLLQMRVVVGLKKDWNTPEVQSQIKQIVLNPKWHVPTTIIKKELLKKIKKEPDYLEKENIRAYEMKDGEKVEVDVSTYDWNAPDATKIILVQDSGDRNALGKMKFLFPNPYDIYMHDTPQKTFFSHQMRSASHGCVRLEKPMELAKFVLAGSPWTEEKINKLIDKDREITQYITPPEPVDVYIDYFTAWVDEDDTIQFRQDIYKKDALMKQIFKF